MVSYPQLLLSEEIVIYIRASITYSIIILKASITCSIICTCDSIAQAEFKRLGRLVELKLRSNLADICNLRLIAYKFII